LAFALAAMHKIKLRHCFAVCTTIFDYVS